MFGHKSIEEFKACAVLPDVEESDINSLLTIGHTWLVEGIKGDTIAVTGGDNAVGDVELMARFEILRGDVSEVESSAHMLDCGGGVWVTGGNQVLIQIIRETVVAKNFFPG